MFNHTLGLGRSATKSIAESDYGSEKEMVNPLLENSGEYEYVCFVCPVP